MTDTAPAAVLWDMDGTLVDTEPYWMSAEGDLVREHGGQWSHDEAIQLVGQGLTFSAEVLQRAGVDLSVDDIIETLTSRVVQQLSEFGVPWRPGARELLSSLRDAGIPTALVTMSFERMALQIVDAIGFDAFDAIVTGDHVSQPKPHPEAYLRGAELLGVDVAQCLALEDSVPGIRSAFSAGATVIGVPFMIALPSDVTHALWDTLDGRGIADLTAVHTAKVSA